MDGSKVFVKAAADVSRESSSFAQHERYRFFDKVLSE
ncbi:hypothetical protein BH10PSE19_BH10PSE19_20070 [soil metagenome]